MLSTLIRWVLSRLAGLRAEDWERVVDWVVTAEHDLTDGGLRRDWVAARIREAWPTVGQWLVDALLGLACGYAARKGWIKLGK